MIKQKKIIVTTLQKIRSNSRIAFRIHPPTREVCEEVDESLQDRISEDD